MDSAAAERVIPVVEEKVDPLAATHSKWMARLLLSLALTAVSGLFGLVVSVFGAIGVLDDSGPLMTVGSLLILLALISAFVSAHCLDQANAARKTMRMKAVRAAELRAEKREI